MEIIIIVVAIILRVTFVIYVVHLLELCLPLNPFRLFLLVLAPLYLGLISAGVSHDLEFIHAEVSLEIGS